MIGFIPIGVYFCISLDIFVLGTANVTEKIENSVTNTPNNLNTSIPEKNLKIAFLTDGLFSDAGWGAFGYNAAQALQEKYAYVVHLKENVPISMIENTLREYAEAASITPYPEVSATCNKISAPLCIWEMAAIFPLVELSQSSK